MTSKFEQLIEYVINDEEAKAKELFHDIVVEKSREIYENLMNDEEMDSFGGDSSDRLINDVEAEERGMQEGEEEFDDESEEEFDDEGGEEDYSEESEEEFDDEGDDDFAMDNGDGDIEDRVVDLEDKLDELMAEFETIMGGEGGNDGIDSDLEGQDGDELAGDALAQDDTMAFQDDEAMMENITLDKVAAPKYGDDGANTKSPVAFNSGARGMAASPVRMTGDTAQGRSAPKTTDMPQAGKYRNVPGKGGSNSKLDTAPRPTLTQASGTNTRTPFPKG